MAAIVQQVAGGTVTAVGGILKEVGAAIDPGQIPMQQAMDMNVARMGLTVEEHIHFKQPDGTNEVFLLDKLEMSKLIMDMCCPVCCTHIPFTSDKRTMEYTKLCGLCSCRWAVSIDGVEVGAMKDVGCCENGCMFWCCPCLTCDGYAKVMGMANAGKEEKFVFAKKLMPCWPLAMACGAFVGALCIPCVSMQGCYNYINDTPIMTVSQPVYQGPWNRASNSEPPKAIGKFYSAFRWIPIGLCCACPLPMKYYYKATTPEGYNLGNDQPLLAMVLSLYRGLPTPCKICSPAGFQIPTGMPCFDIGLETETTWSNVRETMKETK